MSYARFSHADVYVYQDCGGYLCCCGCWLNRPEGKDGFGRSQYFSTTAEMLAHLEKHKAAGHDVPDDTIEALKEDAAENDAWMAKVAAGMCPSCNGSGVCHNYHVEVGETECCHAGAPFCRCDLARHQCWECQGTGKIAARGAP
jgi:hypothetical protein